MSELFDRWKTFLEAFPREPFARSHAPDEASLGVQIGAPSGGVPHDVPPRLGEGSTRIEAVRPPRGVTVLRRAAGSQPPPIAAARPSRSEAPLGPVGVELGAHAALVSSANQLDGVTCVSRAASLDTFVVSLDEGRPLAVRISARRLAPDLSARTIGNAFDEELVQITDPADPSATYQLAVRGVYVIHVSDALDPAGVERALGHELAVLVARHRRGLPAPSSTATAAAPPLRGATIAPLSLRDGLPGSAERRALVEPDLGAITRRSAIAPAADRRQSRELSRSPLAPRCARPGCTVCDRRGR
jgi:hypothetical protein